MKLISGEVLRPDLYFTKIILPLSEYFFFFWRRRRGVAKVDGAKVSSRSEIMVDQLELVVVKMEGKWVDS